MANVYSVLSMSSVATVLMAGNVQAQSIPPEGPVSVIFTATPSPQADADRHRQRVCPRDQTRAVSSSVSADCRDKFDLSASCRVLHCRSGRT
jgi:hypothetical protein